MHRIIQGPDKNMWFTELKSDRVGRVDGQSR
jgi:streptogramin lyase